MHNKQIEEQIYNILADFALVVDDCHKRGVEPDCQKEIKLLTTLTSQIRQEERQRIMDTTHYLRGIDIPECHVSIDMDMKTNVYAMTLAGKVQAEILANRLILWTKLQVLELEKELQKKVFDLIKKVTDV